ncbi:MAG TPA: alpha/beta hydrolase, partial [Rhizomicrobium sp.]|nr:alpha/beta hydrolase [Rhizomicrobium sp.]
RGLIFVTMDHLGVGDSSIDLTDDLRVEHMADANHAFMRTIVQQLGEGILAADFPPILDPFILGMGQSMGAGVTMVMQGRHGCFHAIAPLGISAYHTCLPQPSPEQFKAARDAFSFSRLTPLDQLQIAATSQHVPDFRYPFHWQDEPREIQDQDMEGGYPLRRTSPKFGSMTVPRCAVAMMSPGYFTPEVSRITCPVLMGYGERDTSADMRREATAFFNSNDVSVFIVPRMAHMHNFAGTRQVLWQRIADWAEMQSKART